MIASICNVLGKSTTEWRTLRHVRDLWQAATKKEHGLAICAPALGGLLVTKRTYTIAGQDRIVPGHIGFVSAIKENLHFLHANPKAGRVEEIVLKDTQTALGNISLNGFTAG